MFQKYNLPIYGGGINQMDVSMLSNNIFKIHFNSNRFESSIDQSNTGGTDIRQGGSLIKVRWRIKLKVKYKREPNFLLSK